MVRRQSGEATAFEFKRKVHAHLSPISLVPLGMTAYQITLLELQGKKETVASFLEGWPPKPAVEAGK
jgi:hypothetical protein